MNLWTKLEAMVYANLEGEGEGEGKVLPVL